MMKFYSGWVIKLTTWLDWELVKRGGGGGKIQVDGITSETPPSSSADEKCRETDRAEAVLTGLFSELVGKQKQTDSLASLRLP